VLARLLFDRSARELSPFEIAQLAQAVAGATGVGGGGGGFMDRIRRTLGLDRLAVGSSNEAVQRESSDGESGRSGTGAPTLEAGRYVADGVYVGVQQGTEAGTARAGVRVDITPRLRLEAQTGDREAGERLGFSWEYEW
jgi:translocation and assembly module TamB